MKAYDDGQAVIHLGDVRDVLRELPDKSAHMCVTSPPYWGLRDYGVAGQLGLETTPEEYVTNMVDVFREVRRVLRDDGTLWLNIGDSYAGSGRGEGGSGIHSSKQVTNRGAYFDSNSLDLRAVRNDGCKPKDLVGIPWMVAFALRADGWYLRSDIIWAKPNPMPESVTDRPTKAHEYLFLLSKRERYYYDADAIAERAVALVNRGGNIGISEHGEGVILGRATDPHSGLGRHWEPDGGRNKRTVWTIATQPYPEAHFATFPEALVEPCILAGSPSGGTVLEPFAGSGTTLAVAKRLGRRAIGIELNESYIDLARKRCAQMGMILEEPA